MASYGLATASEAPTNVSAERAWVILIHAELHPENTWHLEEISEKGEQDRHDDQESDVEEIVVEATQTKQSQCEPISTSQPWGPCILLFEFQELVYVQLCRLL